MGLFDIFKARKITEGYIEQSKDWKDGYKFTKMLADNSFVNNEYGKIFESEKTSLYQRLKIAADINQIDLMLKLCENMSPPYYILYVLVVPRYGHEQGRYQSRPIENIKELRLFLNRYKDYFETDGRHHVWIGTTQNSGLLIYDHHNVILAYGQLDSYIASLQKLGFQEMLFSFPVPHAHRYNTDNDMIEDQILQHWEWTIFPVTKEDTYDE
ncbi:hypothetical protein EMA8858_04154 [Emticicia aquatica]|uniref:DUF695 domain-containing protein n=1 Tax=Emticicia aquatica TaxID=1681835 RepID=A0ABN8F2D9_9BACT|nr:hypothetical protein [Emticicia aquatica]CAH0998019.1 hypothetical protein EMA8858_04154 [Emticicia aquatica]